MVRAGCVENGCRGEGTLIVPSGSGGGLLWCEEHRSSAEAHASRAGGTVRKFKAPE